MTTHLGQHAIAQHLARMGINIQDGTDWAGCHKTCKSTSGGTIQAGSHWIKSWSSTQKVVALSSGEAELIAAVKMSTEALGMMSMTHDWGLSYGARIMADSSAALGIIQRKRVRKTQAHTSEYVVGPRPKRERSSRVSQSRGR